LEIPLNSRYPYLERDLVARASCSHVALPSKRCLARQRVRLRQRLHRRSCNPSLNQQSRPVMSKSSSSHLEGRHELPPESIKRTSGRSVDLADFPTDSYFSPTTLTIFSGGISCQQTGSRRVLVTIVNGSTERAKTRKIYSSQSSSPTVKTYQRLPRMMPHQPSINLDGSHVSLRSRRWRR
jgi:hypothetical protein